MIGSAGALCKLLLVVVVVVVVVVLLLLLVLVLMVGVGVLLLLHLLLFRVSWWRLSTWSTPSLEPHKGFSIALSGPRGFTAPLGLLLLSACHHVLRPPARCLLPSCQHGIPPAPLLRPTIVSCPSLPEFCINMAWMEKMMSLDMANTCICSPESINQIGELASDSKGARLLGLLCLL